jgi:hypothetical protein
MKWLLAITLLLLFTLTACTAITPPVPSDTPTEIPSVSVITSAPSETATAEPSPSSAAIIVPEHEIELVAKTLRGECYDDEEDDKREVAKVICNRVAAGFGGGIEAVITAHKQFIGYRESNEPTANDYKIAHEVLTVWYESGCLPMSEYLYFSSGGGHKNIFRKEWGEAS